MVDGNDAVRTFRFRLGAVLLLKHALAAMTLWAVLWGTTVLILRAGFGLQADTLLWGLLGFPLMILPAVWLMRRLPGATAIRALLDQEARAGGLLMAGAEVPLGNWKLPKRQQPEIHWDGGKSWAQFAAAATYVLIGFLVPQAAFPQLQGSTFQIDREVEQIAKQIDVLKENAVLEPERAQNLKEKLKQVKEEARANEPAKTLEAIDHLQDVTKQEAAKAAEKAAQAVERLRKTKTLNDAVAQSNAGDALDPKVLALAMKELSSLVDELKKENQLARELDKELSKALKEGKLSKEQLDALAKALKDSQGKADKLLENLKEAKLISAEMLKECKGCKEGNGDPKEGAKELAKYLKECNGKEAKEGLKQALARCSSNRPCRGGITRGRGDAALTFGDESNKDGSKFKELILPPADLAALKDSQLNGLSTTAPKVDPGGPSTSGALTGAATGGGSANTQVILPRHRDTVQKYFERKDR